MCSAPKAPLKQDAKFQRFKSNGVLPKLQNYRVVFNGELSHTAPILNLNQ